MKRFLFLVPVLWGLVLLSSCHLPEPLSTTASPAVPVDTTTVYLIRHGWHAGIAVRPAHLPPQALPAFPGVPDAPYLEIGWGEGRYFPNPDPGVWTLLRAGGWPTASVVHVVPVADSIPNAFSSQRIVRLRLDAAALNRLAAFLRASLQTDGNDRAVPAAPGYYPRSRFFASPLRYHVFQNCNHWVAEALEAAGCATARWRALTVGALLDQAARCGTEIRP